MSIDITPYVLAGGRSSRFGEDKARAELGGMPLVARVARHLQEVFDQPATVVSAPDRDYGDLGLYTIFDEVPDGGPMSGIHRALLDSPTDRVAVAACDLSGLTPELWTPLLAARDEALAVAYNDGRHWQPVLALYHVSLITELERRLGEGRRGMQPLLDGFGRAVQSTPAVENVVSVDTPEVLDRLRQREAG